MYGDSPHMITLKNELFNSDEDRVRRREELIDWITRIRSFSVTGKTLQVRAQLKPRKNARPERPRKKMSYQRNCNCDTPSEFNEGLT
jgi:hypothetical protein